jgi:hypothetical protein
MNNNSCVDSRGSNIVADFDQDEAESSRKDFFSDGKSVINEVLWRFLPPSTRLGRAEELAGEIWAKIAEEHEKVGAE